MRAIPRLAVALCAASLPAPATVSAQMPASIKIGVLNDMSGPHADLSGKGSLKARIAQRSGMQEQACI